MNIPVCVPIKFYNQGSLGLFFNFLNILMYSVKFEKYLVKEAVFYRNEHFRFQLKLSIVEGQPLCVTILLCGDFSLSFISKTNFSHSNLYLLEASTKWVSGVVVRISPFHEGDRGFKSHIHQSQRSALRATFTKSLAQFS